MRRFKLWIPIIGLTVPWIVLLGVIAFGRFLCYEGFDPMEFDETAWKAADHERRGHMADDLVDRKLLTEMSLEQVTEFLGRPDDVILEPHQRFRYHLGRRGRRPNCPLPMTDYSLLIWFDSQGTVNTVSIAD